MRGSFTDAGDGTPSKQVHITNHLELERIELIALGLIEGLEALNISGFIEDIDQGDLIPHLSYTVPTGKTLLINKISTSIDRAFLATGNRGARVLLNGAYISTLRTDGAGQADYKPSSLRFNEGETINITSELSQNNTSLLSTLSGILVDNIIWEL